MAYCDERFFVLNYTKCELCPASEGAVCNGSEVLSAQPNYWRAGYYDVHGKYHPNTAQHKFLRCPTAACMGGPESSCLTGTGPVCATCHSPYTFNVMFSRCTACDMPVFVYVLVLLVCVLVVNLLLELLVTRSMKFLRHPVSGHTVLLRLLILDVQILSLIYAAISEPDANSQPNSLNAFVHVFFPFAQISAALGCLTGWSAYGHTYFHICLPLITVIQLLLFDSLFSRICTSLKLRNGGRFKFKLKELCRLLFTSRAYRMLPERVRTSIDQCLGVSDTIAALTRDTRFQPKGLVRGAEIVLPPCNVCTLTFAKWGCLDCGDTQRRPCSPQGSDADWTTEAGSACDSRGRLRVLCSWCNLHLHPKHNDELSGHRRAPLHFAGQSKVKDESVPWRHKVKLMMWEAYRLAGIPAVYGRGGYNSDDITKVRVGAGGGLLSQEAVMTE